MSRSKPNISQKLCRDHHLQPLITYVAPACTAHDGCAQARIPLKWPSWRQGCSWGSTRPTPANSSVCRIDLDFNQSRDPRVSSGAAWYRDLAHLAGHAEPRAGPTCVANVLVPARVEVHSGGAFSYATRPSHARRAVQVSTDRAATATSMRSKTCFACGTVQKPRSRMSLDAYRMSSLCRCVLVAANTVLR